MRRMYHCLLLLVAVLMTACGSAQPITTNTTATAVVAVATPAPAVTNPPAQATVAAPTAALAPTNTAAPTNTTAPTVAPTSAVALAAEQVVDVGGYAYRPPESFKVEASGNISVLQKEGDESNDTGIVIVGGLLKSLPFELSGSTDTLDQLLDAFLKGFSGEDDLPSKATERADRTLGGVPARTALLRDVSSKGEQIVSRVIVARPSAEHIFMMLGAAPEPAWDAVAAQFEAVASTVRFSEPVAAATTAAETAVAVAEPTAKPTTATATEATTAAPAETEAAATTLAVTTDPVPAKSTEPGMLCAGTFGYGVSCLTADGWQSFARSKSTIGSDLIAATTVCPDQRVLFAHSSGISAWNGSKWTQYPEWGSGSAEAMVCDGSGGIWIAHYEGVSYFDGKQWTTHGSDKLATGTAANDLVYDVAIAPDNNVYVVTSKSIARFDGKDWTVFQAGQGYDKELFLAKVAVAPDGTVYVAHSSGLLMGDGKAWTNIDNSDYLTVQSLAVDPQGHVWVGTFSDGIQIYDGSTWSTYSTENSDLSSDHVRSITFDGQGRAWVGTAWGLNVFTDDTWQAYHMHTTDLADNEIYDLAVVDGGPALPELQTKPVGSITGQVNSADNNPLVDKVVEVCVEDIGGSFDGSSPCADQQFVKQTKTDAEGNFSLTDLPPGHYVLAIQTETSWAQLTGQFSLSERVDVLPGKEMNLGTLTIKSE